MEFPVDRYRLDTLGCNDTIHFNNAGCSMHPMQVVESICNYLMEEALTGGYELAHQRASLLNDFYNLGAEMLHAAPNNIAFVSSATDGFAKALSSIPWHTGDVILTTINDYVSSQIQFASLHKRFGVEVVRAANTPQGDVDIDSIEALIKQYHPRAISITHIPNNTGMIQPVEQIGDLCEKYDIWYFVDACQSAGQIPLDVTSIKCDFLSFSMRKFLRGPRGCGMLYVSDKALKAGLEPLFIDMRGADWTEANKYQPVPDAKRFEYVEQSYGIITGAIAAMRYYLNVGPDQIALYNAELCAYARQQLSAIPHIHLQDRGARLSAIISLTSDRSDPMYFKEILNRNGINAGAASRKFALLDFDQKGVSGAVRISPHYYNTFEEVDKMIAVIKENAI